MIQSYEDKHNFRDQNCPFVLNKKFLVQTIVITFIYLLALFIVQNLKKFLQWIQNYDDAPFLGHLPQTIFILENYYYRSHVPISLFSCAKFKKKFWAKNGSFPQNRIFSEYLLMSLVPFINVYLHAKNQSQILIY